MASTKNAHSLSVSRPQPCSRHPPNTSRPLVTLPTHAVIPQQALLTIFDSALFAFHSDFHTHANSPQHTIPFPFTNIRFAI